MLFALALCASVAVRLLRRAIFVRCLGNAERASHFAGAASAIALICAMAWLLHTHWTTAPNRWIGGNPMNVRLIGNHPGDGPLSEVNGINSHVRKIMAAHGFRRREITAHMESAGFRCFVRTLRKSPDTEDVFCLARRSIFGMRHELWEVNFTFRMPENRAVRSVGGVVTELPNGAWLHDWSIAERWVLCKRYNDCEKK
ncbi:MAG: hypothetical protein ACKVP7_17410 [Hyphomicrobiaceae bacterium]